MYLVVVAVTTPGWYPDVAELRRTLRSSAAGTDRLQHAYLEVQGERTVFSLFLQAAGGEQAERLAEQLSRRTMAALSPPNRWSLQRTYLP